MQPLLINWKITLLFTETRTSYFKSICCIPYFIIVLLLITCAQVGIGLAVACDFEESTAVKAVLISLVSILGLATVANMYTWGQTLMAVVFSQRRRVVRSAEHIDDLKMDGFMQHLKKEVCFLIFIFFFFFK